MIRHPAQRLMLPLAIILFVLPIVFAAAPPSSNFPKATLFFDRFVPYAEQTKLVGNDDILFNSVGIMTNEDETRARITVQAMPDCPENAPYQADVLQCFVLTPSFDSNNIIRSAIAFKVPRAWMQANNYTSVELRRYSYSWNNNLQGQLSSWRPARTIFDHEDTDYVYYIAYSDGVDYFSIVGLHTPQDSVPIQTPENTGSSVSAQTDVARTSNQITGAATLAVPTAATNAMAIIMLFIVCMACMTAMPFVLDKKEEQSQFNELVRHIRKSDASEENLRKQLSDVGWDDWQINLAFREAKEKL